MWFKTFCGYLEKITSFVLPDEHFIKFTIYEFNSNQPFKNRYHCRFERYDGIIMIFKNIITQEEYKMNIREFEDLVNNGDITNYMVEEQIYKNIHKILELSKDKDIVFYAMIDNNIIEYKCLKGTEVKDDKLEVYISVNGGREYYFKIHIRNIPIEIYFK